MLSQIAQYLLEVASGLLVFLLLARLLLQWLRASFRNPLGHFVIATTHWLVAPMRRVIPPLGTLDLATLLAAWLVQLAALAALYGLRGVDLGAAPGVALGMLATLSALDVLRYAIYLLSFALIAQAVLSWVNPYSPVAPVFDAMTRPILAPVRRRMPPMAGIDLSPLLVLVLLQVLLIALAHLRAAAASAF